MEWTDKSLVNAAVDNAGFGTQASLLWRDSRSGIDREVTVSISRGRPGGVDDRNANLPKSLRIIILVILQRQLMPHA